MDIQMAHGRRVPEPKGMICAAHEHLHQCVFEARQGRGREWIAKECNRGGRLAECKARYMREFPGGTCYRSPPSSSGVFLSRGGAGRGGVSRAVPRWRTMPHAIPLQVGRTHQWIGFFRQPLSARLFSIRVGKRIVLSAFKLHRLWRLLALPP